MARTTSEEPTLESLPRALREDIEELLSRRLGARCELATYQSLSRRVSWVARVYAAPRGEPPRTFIAKHVPPEAYGSSDTSAWRAEFLEEVAAYELFSTVDPPFLERPERLGYDPHGLLLLEDLGTALNHAQPAGDLSGPFATMFARLHAATLGKRRAYDEARARCGVRLDVPDARHDGPENRRTQFALGAKVLSEWCGLVGLASEQTVHALLAELQAGIEAPGPLQAVTHDDLAHGRQCALRDGLLRMFDFENARYGSALLDVAKLLVGKFERRGGPGGVIVLSWMGMGRELVLHYRRELERAGGPALEDATWNAALADAVAFTTVCQVGMLRYTIDRIAVQGALLPNLYTLLRRMEALLEDSAGRRELRRVLGLLAGRIALTPPAAEPRQGT
jgi:hypothetical protein